MTVSSFSACCLLSWTGLNWFMDCLGSCTFDICQEKPGEIECTKAKEKLRPHCPNYIYFGEGHSTCVVLLDFTYWFFPTISFKSRKRWQKFEKCILLIWYGCKYMQSKSLYVHYLLQLLPFASFDPVVKRGVQGHHRSTSLVLTSVVNNSSHVAHRMTLYAVKV